ncbi:hypothetical protein ACOSP7_027861 [Xanthoceras sorbifolium]
MDHQSIMYRDPELEASFSFSGFDFMINSSDLCLFSDVEDGDNDDDQYIEIAFEKPTKHADDDDDDGLELRISFSSSLPCSHMNNNTALSRTTTVESIGSDSIETVTTPSSSSTSTLSCSSADAHWAAASPPTTSQPSTPIKRKVVQFRAVNRLLGSFLSIPRTPSKIIEKSDHDNNSPEHETTNNHMKLVQTRNSPKITKTTSGGIMMRLMTKCRSVNIRTLLASLVRPYQIIINSASLQGSGGQKKKNNSNKRSSNNKSSTSTLGLVKPFENHKDNGRERSRVFDMNMDAIRGVLQSMSITSLGRRGNKFNRSSSPSIMMTKGNPNHDQTKMLYATTTTDHNSVQGAIAHCKTSFGQTSDFCL